jgi:hypothetical protein
MIGSVEIISSKLPVMTQVSIKNVSSGGEAPSASLKIHKASLAIINPRIISTINSTIYPPP